MVVLFIRIFFIIVWSNFPAYNILAYLIYKKINPCIYGDGKSTIKELLTKFNYEYFKDYDNQWATMFYIGLELIKKENKKVISLLNEINENEKLLFLYYKE